MTVFHLAHASDWDAAVAAGDYRVSTRGMSLDEVGFIHAASAEQLAGVAERFYRDDPEPLVVLEVSEELLGFSVRWEDGGGELFPHLYGAIPIGAVTAVIPAVVDAAGRLILAR